MKIDIPYEVADEITIQSLLDAIRYSSKRHNDIHEETSNWVDTLQALHITLEHFAGKKRYKELIKEGDL